MPITIPLDPNETEALAVASKEVSLYSEEVLEASKVLKMNPEEIVEAATEEEMPPEDYAFIMMLSKKVNHNIAKRWNQHFNFS